MTDFLSSSSFFFLTSLLPLTVHSFSQTATPEPALTLHNVRVLNENLSYAIFVLKEFIKKFYWMMMKIIQKRESMMSIKWHQAQMTSQDGNFSLLHLRCFVHAKIQHFED